MCDIDVYKIPGFSLEDILQTACEIKGIPDVEAVKTRLKKQELADTRSAYFIIANNYTNKTPAQIGSIVNRDRTTVIAAKRNEDVKEIKSIVNQIKQIYGL